MERHSPTPRRGRARLSVRRKLTCAIASVVVLSLGAWLAWFVHLEFGRTIGPVAGTSPDIEPCAPAPESPTTVAISVASLTVEANTVWIELGFSGREHHASLMNRIAFDSADDPDRLWTLTGPTGRPVSLRPYRRWTRGSFSAPGSLSHTFDDEGIGCAVYNTLFHVRRAKEPGEYTLTLDRESVQALADALPADGLLASHVNVTIPRASVTFTVTR